MAWVQWKRGYCSSGSAAIAAIIEPRYKLSTLVFTFYLYPQKNRTKTSKLRLNLSLQTKYNTVQCAMISCDSPCSARIVPKAVYGSSYYHLFPVRQKVPYVSALSGVRGCCPVRNRLRATDRPTVCWSATAECSLIIDAGRLALVSAVRYATTIHR